MATGTKSKPIAYSLPGAAEACGVSPKTLTRAIHAGQLKAKKVGRVYSIRASDLEEWHDSLPDA